MEFLIDDAPSSYNGILGSPALIELKMIVSIYSSTLEVGTTIGLFVIHDYRHVGWEYFIASKAEVEHSMVAEKLKDNEDGNRSCSLNVNLNYTGLMYDTRIGEFELGKIF